MYITLLLGFPFFCSRLVQSWAKKGALGCVNLSPAARGSQEAGFTQPRAHSLAQPCTAVPLVMPGLGRKTEGHSATLLH